MGVPWEGACEGHGNRKGRGLEGGGELAGSVREAAAAGQGEVGGTGFETLS